MKIGILLSDFMGNYIGHFLELCKKHNISIDIFKFKNDETQFPAPNAYILNTEWRPKDFKSNKEIENEIKSLVNVDDYDYFLCDVRCLSFKNACNFFHLHSLKYKIENTTNNIYKFVVTIGHLKRIMQEAQYYKNSKLAIVGSKGMKEDYNKNCNIPNEKIRIIHPGIDNINISLTDKKEPHKKFTVGSVTCGFDLKGGYTILGALRKLKKEYSPEEINFKFINPNYEKQWQLKLYLKFFGLEKYVEILPYTNNISEFYSKLDCYVCASKSEAFGRVVSEAMAFGIPVISASNVGASDIIENGVNGYVFEKNNHTYETIAGMIKNIIDNKEKQVEISQRARQTVLSITWKSFAEQLFKYIYEGNN